MDTILSALAAQHAELAELVDRCDDDDWERPTRCVGWDVAAVLVHLAQTVEFATASAHGDLDHHPHGFLGDRESQTASVDDAVVKVEPGFVVHRASGGTCRPAAFW